MVEFLSIPRNSKFYLTQQIGSLERGLTKWNKDEFDNVTFKQNQLTIELNELDLCRKLGILVMRRCKNRFRCGLSLKKKYILMQEISQRQKSRALWLQEGDKNTKFFQLVANSHRQNDTISPMLIDEVLIANRDTIKEHIVQFYANLFKEDAYR